MARRRSLSLEAIHQSLNTECPHCHHSVTPAERHHSDIEHLRCPKMSGAICAKGSWQADSNGIGARNVYVSGPGGLWIISPEGKDLGTIVGPEHPHNFARADDDGKTLYLCSKTGLYRIRLNIPGIRL
jgi:hypothetical protein